MNAEPAVDLSLIILSWNTRDLTLACLGALRRCQAASPMRFEVLVIDNASADDSVEAIRRAHPEVRLFRNHENQGYARGVNQGLRLARGRKVVLLGSDTEVSPGTLDRMAGFLDENPKVGAVAPRLVNADGSLQRACMRFPDLRTALVYDTPVEALFPDNRELRRYFYKDWSHDQSALVDQPPGTCIMVRREVLDQVGLMDRKLWLFFNDVDWCLRMRRRGFEIAYLHEGTEVLHHLGQSTKRFPTFPFEWHKNRLDFFRKHYHAAGAFVVKAAMVYVGIREVIRIRRRLEKTRDFIAHASQVVRALGQVLMR